MRYPVLLTIGIFVSSLIATAAAAQGLEQKCLDNVKDICQDDDASICFLKESNWDYTLPECEGDIQSLIEGANDFYATDPPPSGASFGGKVRSGAGMEFSQIGSLKEGAAVSIIRNVGSEMNGYPWFKIVYLHPKTESMMVGYQWGGILCSNVAQPGIYKICPDGWGGKNPWNQEMSITEDAIAPVHGNSDEDNAMIEAEAGNVIKECLRAAHADGQNGSSCLNRYVDDCLERDGNHTTVNMRQCIRREGVAWDEQLNLTYHQSMLLLGDEKKRTSLRAAQRLWIKFSRSYCGVTVHLQGGSINQLNQDFCMLEMTARQSIRLHQMASNLAGQ